MRVIAAWVLWALIAGTSASAEPSGEDLEKTVYTATEGETREEFENALAELGRSAENNHDEQFRTAIDVVKTALYNKASMRARCAGEWGRATGEAAELQSRFL